MSSVDETSELVSLPNSEDASSSDGEDLSRLLMDFSSGDLLDENKIPTEDLNRLHEYYSKSCPENEQFYRIFASCYIERRQWKQARYDLYCLLYLLEKNSKEYNEIIDRLKHVEERMLAEIIPIPSVYKEQLFFRDLNDYTGTWVSQMGYTDVLKTQSFENIKNDGTEIIISKRHLRPGELLLKSKPLSVAPWRIYPIRSNVEYNCSSTMTQSHSCFHCLNISNSPGAPNTYITCPNNPHECPYVFCSEDCFLNNSSIHFSECNHIAKIKAFSDKFVGNTLALLVLRTLVRCKLFQENCYRTVESTDSKPTPLERNELLDKILNLEVDCPKIQLTHNSVLESIDRFAYFLLKELGAESCLYLTVKELKHFIIALWVNCIPVSPEIDSYGENLQNPLGGVVFSLETLGWKESTIPNCSVNFDSNGQITIRSIYNIEPDTALYVNTTTDKYLPEFIQTTQFWSVRFLLSHSEIPGSSLDLCSIRCNTCINGFCHSSGFKLTSKYANEYDTNEKSSEEPTNFEGEVFVRNAPHKCRINYFWNCDGCKVLHTDNLNLLQNTAEGVIRKVKQLYSSGQYLIARRMLQKFVDNWSGVLHPNHYLMYNANLLLAGFLMNKAGGNPIVALRHLKRALIMADEILPKACQEKAYMYERLADLMFRVHTLGGVERTCNTYAKRLILEASYSALWNWTIIAGSRSKEALLSIQKSRVFAFKLNVHTPPLYRKLNIDVPRKYFEILKTVTRSNIVSQTLMKNFVSDLYDSVENKSKETAANTAIDIAFIAAQDGNTTDCIIDLLTDVESFGILQHGTGLSVLGIASSNCNINLVSALLKSFQDRITQSLEFISNSSEYSDSVRKAEETILNLCYSIVGGNELGITPLIAVASAPSQFDQGDSVEGNVNEETFILETESKIAKIIVNNASMCNDVLKDYEDKIMKLKPRKLSEFMKINPNLQKLLLDAKTSHVLNCQTALHYASARGKFFLVEYLAKMGVDVNRMNLEGATPLHFAALNGHYDIVKLLIHLNAKVGAKLFTGETPLHLAVLNLHEPVVKILIEPYSEKFKSNNLSNDAYDPISKSNKRGPSIWHALVGGVYKNGTSHSSEAVVKDKIIDLGSLIKRLLNAVKIAKLLAKSLKTQGVFGTYIWSNKLPSEMLWEQWKRSLEDYSGISESTDKKNSRENLNGWNTEAYNKTKPSSTGFNEHTFRNDCKLPNNTNDRVFAATRAVQLLVQILKRIECMCDKKPNTA